MDITDELKQELRMVINKKFFEDSEAWPFVESREILKKRSKILEKKGYVLFQTGYGPSGLPHIGTFGEVVRTVFVRHAFSLIAPNIPTKMFCVSDDIDGLRKVPDNKSMMNEYIVISPNINDQ